MLIIVFCFTQTITVMSKNKSAAVHYAIRKVEEIEHTGIIYKGSCTLLDINGQESYLYIEIKGGFIIAFRENGFLSEYNLDSPSKPYDINKNGVKIYAGPFNYIELENERELKKTISSFTKEIKEINNAFIAEASNYIPDSSKAMTASWTGISSSSMTKYYSGMWVNNSTNYPTSSGYPSGGICGTIAMAGLLAYYQDNVNSNYVPTSLRTVNSSSPGSLITTLFTYIDQGAPNGTLPSDLVNGGNHFLQDYSYASPGHRFVPNLLTVWNASVQKIYANYPLVIGLLAALGSTYGNHWVLAYQYYDDSGTSNDMLRVVDNHGSYTATIKRAWISSCVMIDNT